MNDQNSESMSQEELLRRTREIRDQLRPGAAQLRELGMEVDAFLEECDRLIAFLEGRSEAWVDVAGFLEKLTTFSNEIRALHDIEREAERINAVASIPGVLDVTEYLAKKLSNPNDARTAALLQSAVEAAHQRSASGEVPVEELQDIALAANAQAGELHRRSQFRTAALALFWESRPPEWWARLPAEGRKELEELLVAWRAEREKILGELPIADRRRLEALRPEDFDKPGALEL